MISLECLHPLIRREYRLRHSPEEAYLNICLELNYLVPSNQHVREWFRCYTSNERYSPQNRPTATQYFLLCKILDEFQNMRTAIAKYSTVNLFSLKMINEYYAIGLRITTTNDYEWVLFDFYHEEEK